ncbi:uncharacterized protein An01g08260 [Aspergillus niger]|uniref:Contig An01c0290, genomic contig n=2 Tax=Aspergillus niger TaxID=5061 RepID=A2Q9L2_ASPNC|nr:uncharacterized protein An01g08260 [Aspergillus niger]CAK43918.1 unnamed protein product [Aspergillus niger]
MAVSNGSDDDDDVIFSGSLSPAALYTCFSIRPYCRTTFGKLNNVSIGPQIDAIGIRPENESGVQIGPAQQSNMMVVERGTIFPYKRYGQFNIDKIVSQVPPWPVEAFVHIFDTSECVWAVTAEGPPYFEGLMLRSCPVAVLLGDVKKVAIFNVSAPIDFQSILCSLGDILVKGRRPKSGGVLVKAGLGFAIGGESRPPDVTSRDTGDLPPSMQTTSQRQGDCVSSQQAAGAFATSSDLFSSAHCPLSFSELVSGSST